MFLCTAGDCWHINQFISALSDLYWSLETIVKCKLKMTDKVLFGICVEFLLFYFIKNSVLYKLIHSEIWILIFLCLLTAKAVSSKIGFQVVGFISYLFRHFLGVRFKFGVQPFGKNVTVSLQNSCSIRAPLWDCEHRIDPLSSKKLRQIIVSLKILYKCDYSDYSYSVKYFKNPASGRHWLSRLMRIIAPSTFFFAV